MPKIESVSNYIDNIKEERNRNQERMLNSLLGFMGVGQVLFAILGLYQSDCTTWNTIAITLSALFFLMSVIIIIILNYTYKTMDQNRIGNHILLPVFAFFALS